MPVGAELHLLGMKGHHAGPSRRAANAPALHEGGTILKRTLFTVLAAVLALAFASTALSAIKINRINFDSPGSDTGSNSSRNAEWIRIKNTGSQTRSLNGWTIRDATNHVYRFQSFTLGAGATVTLHTGSGSNRYGHRYWNQGNYVWNNDGDTARLRNSGGTLIDRCSYSGAGSSVVC